jgi:hypothetical protein
MGDEREDSAESHAIGVSWWMRVLSEVRKHGRTEGLCDVRLPTWFQQLTTAEGKSPVLNSSKGRHGSFTYSALVCFRMGMSGSALLQQSHAAYQVFESRLLAKAIEDGLLLQIEPRVALIVGFFQPFQRVLLVSQPRIDIGKIERSSRLRLRTCLQMIKSLSQVAYVTTGRVGLSQAICQLILAATLKHLFPRTDRFVQLPFQCIAITNAVMQLRPLRVEL